MTQQDAIGLRFLASGFLRVTGWWLDKSSRLAVHDVATQLYALLNAFMQIPTLV